MIASTPKPPYYAVIFTTIRTNIDDGYNEMSDKLIELAQGHDGFLGIESARDGMGISISYWTDLESISKWKNQSDHLLAQQKGKIDGYKSFKTRISKVERDYDFQK
ncbi:MAG: antibiotic biosynthesis monooxygenase [Salinivirgaceae bacterium]|jgi:heme-degrading monooxygenase HmoA|nr:antibiotic biosynthesis monooxygenase [Salinivirgaceae bacterium]